MVNDRFFWETSKFTLEKNNHLYIQSSVKLIVSERKIRISLLSFDEMDRFFSSQIGVLIHDIHNKNVEKYYLEVFILIRISSSDRNKLWETICLFIHLIVNRKRVIFSSNPPDKYYYDRSFCQKYTPCYSEHPKIVNTK